MVALAARPQAVSATRLEPKWSAEYQEQAQGEEGGEGGRERGERGGCGVWCGVVWCGVVWCGVVGRWWWWWWCGLCNNERVSVDTHACMQ